MRAANDPDQDRDRCYRDAHRASRHAYRGYPWRSEKDQRATESSSSKYCFQIVAIVCVPCPRVSGLVGKITARPLGTRLISRSRIPSSGGLLRSSAEFTASSG